MAERSAVIVSGGTYGIGRAITLELARQGWPVVAFGLEARQPGSDAEGGIAGTRDVLAQEDLEAELDRIGHDLKPLDIVLANTSAGARYGEDDYVSKGCGFGRAATLWLTERGVRVVGTDGWSWDAPFIHTKKRWEATHDPSIIWEGHKAGRDIGYCHLEKLHNLEALPATGFTVSCFPVKIRAASAGSCW